jgi:hypothetical protein
MSESVNGSTDARWEDETPSGLAVGRYLSGPEKEDLEGHALRLVSIFNDPDNLYEGKPSPRWLVNATIVESGELICLTFGSNPARNAIFAAGARALEGGKRFLVAMENVHPPKGADYRIIRSATDEEVDLALVAWSKLSKDAAGDVIWPTEAAALPGEKLRKARR